MEAFCVPIVLWERHVSFADSLKEGDIIRIEGVRQNEKGLVSAFQLVFKSCLKVKYSRGDSV